MSRWVLPDGIEELLPAQAKAAEATRRKLLDVFASWGYELVMPPMLEYTESLLVGLGDDIDLRTFRVTDQLTGRLMGLRADITPQVARIDAHSLKQDGPVRLCYAGSVLHTRPQAPLASRSPIQLGAELYGDNSASSDLEIILLMLETLAAAGVGEITLDLGHVGIYTQAVQALSEDQRKRYFDLVQRKAVTELDAFLADENLDNADQLRELIHLHGGRDALERGKACFSGDSAALAAIAAIENIAERVSERLPDIQFYFDLAELRGYHYHTGLVFSALSADSGMALARGGRYDDIGQAFGRARPATGFSLDLKNLISYNPLSSEQSAAAIAAPNITDPELWQAMRTLRLQGEQVINCLDDSVPAQCNRQLVKTDQGWQIEDV